VQKADAAAPHSPDVPALLGYFLQRGGRTAEAEQAYRHALVLRPSDAATATNLSAVLLVRATQTAREQGDAAPVLREALQWAETALLHRPRFYAACNNAAVCCLRLGQTDLAADALTAALETCGTDTDGVLRQRRVVRVV
jgi:Flp pilus assembly protein TadD